MRRYSYTERFVHREFFARRRLYTQRLLCKEVFTQKFLRTDALHKDAFARTKKTHTHRRFYTQNFYIEKPLRRTTFRQKLWRRKLSTQTAQRNFCTPKLLHAETLPRTAFTHRAFRHRNLYAQKSLCTTVFTQTPLHTDAFTQKNFSTALLPLLDHLPFVFPPLKSVSGPSSKDCARALHYMLL